jgi:hypothetical protein
MGGQGATESFARLFLYPSVFHCGGGYADATVPDMIYPLVQWVEDKTAPDQLTITYAPTGGSSFTRPVYPYPEIPKYNGSGPQDSYTSFHAVRSTAARYTNWIGNYLFFQPLSGRGSDQGYNRRG